MKFKKAFTAIVMPFFKHSETNSKRTHYHYSRYGLHFTWLVLTLLLHLTARAQPIFALKAGDKVPDLELTGLLNAKEPTLKFVNLKGKLLILDFWATWCSSCLHHFPTADSLQKQFPADIQIVLVNTKSTRDTREKVLNTLNHFPGFSLPTLVGDTILDQLFPHFSLPHYVWINQAGIVCAMTSAEELTPSTVRHFLDAGETPVFQKNDFDPHRPLYTVKDLPLDHLQQYSIFLKGKIDGIGGGGLRRINDTVRGIILHNRSLIRMYESVVYNKIAGYNDNRIVLDVKDSSGLTYAGTSQPKAAWERTHFYSYEIVVPADRLNHLYDDVLDDLNRNTAYIATFEKRHLNCWVLQRTGNQPIPVSRGGEYLNELDNPDKSRLRNATLIDLCEFINKFSNNAVVLDETGITCNVDLDFKGTVGNVSTLQRQLQKTGIKLAQAYRDIEMLVVRDKPTHQTN